MLVSVCFLIVHVTPPLLVMVEACFVITHFPPHFSIASLLTVPVHPMKHLHSVVQSFSTIADLQRFVTAHSQTVPALEKMRDMVEGCILRMPCLILLITVHSLTARVQLL